MNKRDLNIANIIKNTHTHTTNLNLFAIKKIKKKQILWFTRVDNFLSFIKWFLPHKQLNST